MTENGKQVENLIQNFQYQRFYGSVLNSSANSNLLELIRNWLVSPGWSTSWMVAANRAAIISRGVKTDCKEKEKCLN